MASISAIAAQKRLRCALQLSYDLMPEHDRHKRILRKCDASMPQASTALLIVMTLVSCKLLALEDMLRLSGL